MSADVPQRPQVAVFRAVSLDGFIAGPGGALGWLTPYQGGADGDDNGYAEFAAGIDAIVMGRRTCDVARGFTPWPYAGQPMVVLTRRPLPPDHAAAHGLCTHAGTLAALWPMLAAGGARRVYLDGGGVIRQGLREGWVDELTLSVVPCVLGDGVPLFGEALPSSQRTLLRSRAALRGVVQSTYRRMPGAAVVR